MTARARDWIDVSVPLRDGMVAWPGDPGVRIEAAMRLERGDEYNLTRLSMSAHTGTHMDAPLHFLSGGVGIDEMPFSATIGPARVIGIRDRGSIKPDELRRHRLLRGERILFKTPGAALRWRAAEFDRDFVGISADAAEYLAERRIRTAGIDYLSVGAYDGDASKTHQVLLGAGIWLIEGLDLSRVSPGRYDLICLPLKIVGADGAPARALLRART